LWRKRAKIKKIKNQKNEKNEKSVLFGLIFVTRGGGATNTPLKKQNQFQLSQTAIPGPSVFEEDLEDLEDLHHHGDV
jgi:hypothetical protein